MNNIVELFQHATKQNKSCSQCKKTKFVSEYYLKGDRIDSICKECKKAARNKSYVSKSSADVFDTCAKLFDCYFEVELKSLNKIADRLEALLLRATRENQYES